MFNFNTITIFIITGSILQSVYSFIVNNPLKKIVVTRAISKTIMETMALNIVDEPSIIHEISCNCESHPYLSIYFISFIFYFIYIY